jgi:hypothetical protein
MIKKAVRSALASQAMELDDLPLQALLTGYRLLQRYHRYEVRNLSTIVNHPGAALIVGYHGRPIAHDMCMLAVALHDRLGYLPHGVVHRGVAANGLLQWVSDSLRWVTGDGEEMAAMIARGEHILVTPGGSREGCRSFRHRYKVDWGERVGYLRLALKYRLPIIPVAASGTDDAFIGFNDGHALSKRLRVPYGLPLWLGVGLVGVWPLAVPFPVKIRQIVGDPIDLLDRGPLDPSDKGALLGAHRRVTGVVQRLLDQARAWAAAPGGSSEGSPDGSHGGAEHRVARGEVKRL